MFTCVHPNRTLTCFAWERSNLTIVMKQSIWTIVLRIWDKIKQSILHKFSIELEIDEFDYLQDRNTFLPWFKQLRVRCPRSARVGRGTPSWHAQQLHSPSATKREQLRAPAVHTGHR